MIANNGVVDFTNIDVHEDVFHISGQIEYCPDVLLNQITDHSKCQIVTLPHHLLRFGFGTYAIRIINPGEKHLAIFFEAIKSSAKFYVNGELIHQVGVVSDQKENYEANFASSFINLGHQKEITFVIQVANYFHARTGIQHSPVIGLSHSVLEYYITNIRIKKLIIGALIALMIANFGVALYYKSRSRFSLISAFICLSAIAQLVYHRYDAEFITIHTPVLFQAKLLYFFVYAAHFLWLLAFREWYIERLHFRVLNYLLLFNGFYLFITLILPFRYYANIYFLISFQIFLILAAIYTFSVHIHALKEKIPNAYHGFIINLILFSASIFDCLNVTGSLGIRFNIYPLFVFLTFTFIILSRFRAFYSDYRRIEEKNGEIAEANRKLADLSKFQDTFINKKTSYKMIFKLYSAIYSNIGDVLYVMSDGNFSVLVSKKEKTHLDISLKVIAEFFDETELIRVRRSHLVNVKNITAIKGEKSEYHVQVDGAEIRIGKTYLDDVRRLLPCFFLPN